MKKYALKNIKEQVVEILENNGIVVNKDCDENDLIDITTIDSITFISFIVDIENEFEITIPDELLSINIIQSIEGFSCCINELITSKC